MKWSGETEEQRMVREYEWHKRRAWFPVQILRRYVGVA